MGFKTKEAWSNFANQYGADFIDGGFFKGIRVEYTYKHWPFYLDTFTVSTGKSSSTYTQVRAPFVGTSDFFFKLNRKSVFSKLAKKLGKEYVTTGDGAFDEMFVIKSNDIEIAKILFSSEELRDQIISIKKVRLSIKNNEGKFGHNYQNMGKELYFYADGIVKNTELLTKWFDMFKTTLDKMESIDLAESQRSKVKLYKNKPNI